MTVLCEVGSSHRIPELQAIVAGLDMCTTAIHTLHTHTHTSYTHTHTLHTHVSTHTHAREHTHYTYKHASTHTHYTHISVHANIHTVVLPCCHSVCRYSMKMIERKQATIYSPCPLEYKLILNENFA